MPADVLIDTNIFVRSFDPDYTEHDKIKTALTALASTGGQLCFVPQVAYELRHVLTRNKDIGGMGLSPEEAGRALDHHEALYDLRFPDPRAEYQIFCDLAVELAPRGKNVHDLRLVAAAKTLGIRKLLTLDLKDFKRAKAAGHIEVLTPAEVIKNGV